MEKRVGGTSKEELLDKLKKGKLKIYYESQIKKERGKIENHSGSTYTIRVNESFRETGSDRLFLLTHEIQHVIQGKDRGFRSFPRRDNALGGITSSYLFGQLIEQKHQPYIYMFTPKKHMVLP